jgi:hypothetical protein
MTPVSGAALLLHHRFGTRCMHHNLRTRSIHTLARRLQRPGNPTTVREYLPLHQAQFHSLRLKAMMDGGHRRQIYIMLTCPGLFSFLLDSLLNSYVTRHPSNTISDLLLHSFSNTPHSWSHTYTLIVATLYTREWIRIIVWAKLTRTTIDNAEYEYVTCKLSWCWGW